MRYELVIFDLDGTLIDSQYDLALAVNYTRSLYGFTEIRVDKIRDFIGDGIRTLMEKALPEIGESEMQVAIIKFRAFYGENLLNNTKLYPGVKEVLENLSGIKKAVLTNKPIAFTKTILENFKIDKYFNIVTGGDSGPKRKPAPEPLLDIANKLNIPLGQVIMIGDGKNDILAAKAAGVKCAAAEYGYTASAELLSLKPDYTISNINDVIKIVND